MVDVLQGGNDVVDAGETFEDGNQCEQFVIAHVIEPTSDGNLDRERERQVSGVGFDRAANVQHCLDEISRTVGSYR